MFVALPKAKTASSRKRWQRLSLVTAVTAPHRR